MLYLIAAALGVALDQAVKAYIRAQLAVYKKYEPLIREGGYDRLADPAQDGFAAWQFTAADGSRALVNVVRLENHGNMPVAYVRLKSLRPDAVYQDAATGRRYSGAALMCAGLPLAAEQGEYRAWQIELNCEPKQ